MSIFRIKKAPRGVLAHTWGLANTSNNSSELNEKIMMSGAVDRRIDTPCGSRCHARSRPDGYTPDRLLPRRQRLLRSGRKLRSPNSREKPIFLELR